MTKIDKLFRVLSDGKNHPVSQIQRKTGLNSVSAAVRDLRNEGNTIYLNTRGSNGNRVNYYRMAS